MRVESRCGTKMRSPPSTREPFTIVSMETLFCVTLCLLVPQYYLLLPDVFVRLPSHIHHVLFPVSSEYTGWDRTIISSFPPSSLPLPFLNQTSVATAAKQLLAASSLIHSITLSIYRVVLLLTIGQQRWLLPRSW